MATTKTLTPTNQEITLAAFTEKPDNRTNVTNDDKMADAINTLNSNIAQLNLGVFSSLPNLDNYIGIVGFLLNANVTVDTLYIPAGSRIFGYIYNGIGHFVCLYTGASFTTLRYQGGQGWTVLQRFSNN